MLEGHISRARAKRNFLYSQRFALEAARTECARLSVSVCLSQSVRADLPESPVEDLHVYECGLMTLSGASRWLRRTLTTQMG